MKLLVVYCHPVPESFTAAVRDTAMDALAQVGHEVRLIDLYAEGFAAAMGPQEWKDYLTEGTNEFPVTDHIERIRWAEGIVFVFPTWWYGLPALLKGWLDRVWVPHVTFTLPTGNEPLRANMTNIRLLAGITTCGAPWWWTKVVGEPGRKTIVRGIRAICHRRCRTLWMAHYKMDVSTPASRAAYLAKVRRRMERIV